MMMSMQHSQVGITLNRARVCVGVCVVDMDEVCVGEVMWARRVV